MAGPAHEPARRSGRHRVGLGAPPTTSVRITGRPSPVVLPSPSALPSPVVARPPVGARSSIKEASAKGASSTPRVPLPLPVRVLRTVITFVTLTVLVPLFLVQSFWIPSQSMEPTLHGCPTCRDDRIVVFRLAYHLHAVHRGDIVVFTRPPAVSVAEKYLVKRVIGRPGDILQARAGSVLVNGRALDEKYVPAVCQGTADFGPVTVPPDRLFVMGDNRCNSDDSRYFGTITESSVVGQAVARVWPFSRIGGL